MMEKEKIILTRAGKAKIEADLRELIDITRPQVIDELSAARAQGDLSENADYDAARDRQAEVEGKIKQLEDILANCTILDENPVSAKLVKVGTTVILKDLSTNEEDTFTIVGSVEANPLEGKISNECAIGEAVIGHRAGDIVTIKVAKPYQIEIVKILNGK